MFQVKHVFKGYGKGLRKIIFAHRGVDDAFWKGHYGSKMARACVTIEIPKQLFLNSSDEEQLNV